MFQVLSENFHVFSLHCVDPAMYLIMVRLVGFAQLKEKIWMLLLRVLAKSRIYTPKKVRRAQLKFPDFEHVRKR